MKKEITLQSGEIYIVDAPVSGFCYAWQHRKPSVDLKHGDLVVLISKDPEQTHFLGQPICEVLTHKGRLFMDQRWLGHVQPAAGGVE